MKKSFIVIQLPNDNIRLYNTEADAEAAALVMAEKDRRPTYVVLESKKFLKTEIELKINWGDTGDKLG